MSPDAEPTDQARRLLVLIPELTLWAASQVQRAGEHHDLSLRQYAALRAIATGMVAPGDIARLWQVTPAVITGVIDRLERRGLVRREPDPEDRRRLRLSLTAAGNEVQAAIDHALVVALATQIATADPAERAGLTQGLALLQRVVAALLADGGCQPAAATATAMPAATATAVPAAGARPPNIGSAPSNNARRPRPRVGRIDVDQHGFESRETEYAAMSTATPNERATAPASPSAVSPATPATMTLDLRDPRFMATAHEQYEAIRAQGPMVRVHFGGDEAAATEEQRQHLLAAESFFVTDYDTVVATLLDDRYSVDARTLMTPEQLEAAPPLPEEFRPLAQSLLGIDPPDHTRIRKLVQPSFTGRAMEALRPKIQRTVDDLLDTAEREAADRGETAPDRRLELIDALAFPFPVTVISDLLGVPAGDREQIKGWTANLLRVDAQRGQAEVEDEIRAGLREFIAYLTELFDRKRRAPEDDMISRMVMAEDNGETLTEEETLATVFLMYLAGHVTTVNLVGSGIVALLTNPEQLAKVRAEPALVKNVVEETLRYWGPVDFLPRRIATTPIEIEGTLVERGQAVTVSLAAANRDPAKFDHPTAFDVSRSNANRHVAFGKGIHVCLGAPLARIEGQVAVATLLRRYPDLRLGVADDELAWSGSFLRGFRQVPLRF